MSWDVWFSTRTIDGTPVQLYEKNYTHNCNRMIREAGFDGWWVAVPGMTGAEMAEQLTVVLDAFAADPARFRQMNPENGWGSFSSVRQVLEEMRDVSRRDPQGVWEAWG